MNDHLQQTGTGALADPQELHRLAIVRNLIATMMLGQANGLHDDAQAIYRVGERLLGNGRSLSVSLALASALGGDTAPARDLIVSGLRDWPEAEPAMVSIALALKVAGEPDWMALIDETLSVSSDPNTRLLAHQVLQLNVSGL